MTATRTSLRGAAPAAALLGLLGACAAPVDPPPGEGSLAALGDFDTGVKTDGRQVEWRPWAEPVELVPGERGLGAVDYGECVETSRETRVEETPDATNVHIDLEVSCRSQAYADVAWFVVPADEVAAHVQAGYVSLAIALVGPEGTAMQASVHETEAGTRRGFSGRTRVATADGLYGQGSLQVPIRDGREYHLFVSRGTAGWLGLWDTGRFELEADAKMSFEAPAQ